MAEAYKGMSPQEKANLMSALNRAAQLSADFDKEYGDVYKDKPKKQEPFRERKKKQRASPKATPKKPATGTAKKRPGRGYWGNVHADKLYKEGKLLE